MFISRLELSARWKLICSIRAAPLGQVLSSFLLSPQFIALGVVNIVQHLCLLVPSKRRVKSQESTKQAATHKLRQTKHFELLQLQTPAPLINKTRSSGSSRLIWRLCLRLRAVTSFKTNRHTIDHPGPKWPLLQTQLPAWPGLFPWQCCVPPARQSQRRRLQISSRCELTNSQMVRQIVPHSNRLLPFYSIQIKRTH